jgi:hypothetical protein
MLQRLLIRPHFARTSSEPWNWIAFVFLAFHKGETLLWLTQGKYVAQFRNLAAGNEPFDKLD